MLVFRATIDVVPWGGYLMFFGWPSIGKVMVTLDRLDLLLVTLRGLLLYLFITWISTLSLRPLTVGRALAIERPGLAVDTGMRFVFTRRVFSRVVALDMLPGLTCFAQYGVTIVVLVIADALYCVVFILLYSWSDWQAGKWM